MKTILVLGAGLSSSSMIRYFLENAEEFNWNIRVCDQNLEMVKEKIGDNKRAVALCFNALSSEERLPEIQKVDLVVSMLPARFHVGVARDCIAQKKNLITPSYISEDMKNLD